MQNITSLTSLVSVEGEEVFTTSNIIAEYFDKDHRNVLRDIDRIRENSHCSDLGNENVVSFVEYIEPSNHGGVARRKFKLNEYAAILVIGRMTGEKPLALQIRFLAEFKAIREKLRNPTLAPVDETAKVVAITNLMQLSLQHLGNISDSSKQLFIANMVEKATGQKMLPLPSIKEFWQMNEIAEQYLCANHAGGVLNANVAGKLCKHLQTPENGDLRLSSVNGKEFKQWHWNAAGKAACETILDQLYARKP